MSFTWVPFYEELANRLLDYKNDRKTLIQKVRDVHKNANIELPQLEKNNDFIPDIDPFTVISLFNRGHQNIETRKVICAGYKTVFNINAEIPQDFDGIPVQNYTQYCFYGFYEDPRRDDKCFDDLWNLLEQSIIYADDKTNEPEFISAFDNSLNYYGIALAKITIALFHIRPKTFINLDSTNISFIEKTSKLKVDKNLNGEQYLNLNNQIHNELHSVFNCNSLPELSLKAYNISTISTKKESIDKTHKNDITKKKDNTDMIHKNLILYGPPGTGKTRASIIYAVAIIENGLIKEKNLKINDNELLEKIKDEDYKEICSRYKKYKDDGLIEFTTFHQSFGYEDFVEGIKPVLNDDKLNYKIENGIFKEFCDKATVSTLKDIGLKDSPTIWKVSLEGTNDNPTRQECLKNNHIRIGYDEYGENIDENKTPVYKGKNVINAFCNKMEIGDIVLSCYTNKTIDAIGVITGDYEWADQYQEYKRLRNVNWIVKNIKEDITEINNGKTLTLPTVYQLNISLESVLNIIKKYKKSLIHNEGQNRVIIIDEINRGNISKIFGELITLIEPCKRIGAEEELTVKLPYSRKPFGIPDNIYIIGTMNTADRSIQTMDTALRRRFKFKEIIPDANLLKDIIIDGISIKELLSIINKRIEILYDREHTIGHSCFMTLNKDSKIEDLAEIFEKNIIPLLQEYFYEDYEKIRCVLGDNGKEEQYQIIQKTENLNDVFNIDDEPEDKAFYRINTKALKNKEAYKLKQ